MDVRELSSASCQLHRFLLYVSLDTSSWILVLVTIERFLAVCFPVAHKRVRDVNKALRSIGAVLIIQLCFNMHTFWTRGYEELSVDGNVTIYQCGYKSDHSRLYWIFYHGWVSMLIYCILPFITMLILNVCIIRRLRSLHDATLNRVGSNLSSTGVTNHASSMTRMLLAVTMYFILVTTPAFIVTMVQGYVIYAEEITVQRHARLELIDASLTLLLYLNHSINFFLYCLTGRRFRRVLCEMCACGARSEKPRARNPKLTALLKSANDTSTTASHL